MGKRAAKELAAGHGEQGLSLQRDAQRLLEQTNSGQSGSGDSDGKDQAHQPAPKDSSSSKGKQMRTDADVPREAARLRKRFQLSNYQGLWIYIIFARSTIKTPSTGRSLILTSTNIIRRSLGPIIACGRTTR